MYLLMKMARVASSESDCCGLARYFLRLSVASYI